ncbi:uncharacterized protein LOC116938966 [Petromyzon marinus]|uniref:uncharacterized protein LOC116938966 n=1 Tax=Petromyzon marinus TaxID=7757 RepID=UPI003F700F71
MDASLRCEPGLARWPATMALTRRLETSPCKRAPPSPRVVPASSPRSAATRRPLAPSPQHGRPPCPAPCGADAAAAGAEKDCVTAVASRSPSKLLRHGAGAGRAADAGCTCGVAPGAPQPGSAPHRGAVPAHRLPPAAAAATKPAGASPRAAASPSKGAASAARTVGSPCRISAGAGRPPPAAAAAAASPNKTAAATSNKCTSATNKSLSSPSKIPAGSQKLGSARAAVPVAPHSAVPAAAAAATTLSPTAGSHRHRGDGNADASKNRAPSEATKTRSGILPRSGSRPGSRSGRDKVGTGVAGVKTVCGLGVDSGAGSTNKTGNNPETKPGVVVVTKPGDGAETKPGGGTETKPGIGMITKAASGVMMKPAGGLLIKLGIGSITKPGDGALTKPGSGLITKAASGVLTRPAGVVLTKSRGGAIAKPGDGALTKPGGGALVKAAGGAGARTAAPVSLSRKQEKEAANARLAEAVTRAEGAAANRRTASSVQSAAGRTWSGTAPLRTAGPATRPPTGCATGGAPRAPRRNCKAEALAAARAQGTVHAAKLLQANGDVADDADTGDGETRAAAAAAEEDEETAQGASAEGKAEHDWSGQSKAERDESDTKTKRDESEDSKAERDESHMKAESDESHMKAERDESGTKADHDESGEMKAECNESHMKTERDESDTKTERAESHMKTERDESDTKAESNESHRKIESDESHRKTERDESHRKTERDESDTKAESDESHRKTERDESGTKAECNESHVKIERDESHVKAERDESHVKTERDESDTKAECNESHVKIERDESHVKTERDESDTKAENGESGDMKAESDAREQINALPDELGAPKAALELSEETKSTYKTGGGKKAARDSHEGETDDVDASGTTEATCDASGRGKTSRDLSGELNASRDLGGGAKTPCAGLGQARATRRAGERTTAGFDAGQDTKPPGADAGDAGRGVPPAAGAAGRQPLPPHSGAEAISDVSVFPGAIPELNGVGEALPGAGGVEDGSPLPRPSTTDAGSAAAAAASGMTDLRMSPVAEGNGAKGDDVSRVGAGARARPGASREPAADVRAVTSRADLVRVQVHSHANVDDACGGTGSDTEIKPAVRADVDKNRALSKDVHGTKFTTGAGPGVRLAELSLCEINLSEAADGASSPSLADGGGALSDDRSFRETVSVGVMSEAHQLGDELWGCGGTLGDLSTPSSMGLWEKLDSKTSSPTSTPEELKDTGSLAGGASASGSTLGMSPEFGLKLKMLLESRHAPIYEPRDKTERTLAERLKRDTGNNNNNVVEGGDDDDDEKEDDEDGDDFDNDYYVNDVEKHRTRVLCGIENPAFRDYAAEPDSRAVREAEPRTGRVSGDAGVTAQPELAHVRGGDPHPDCSGSVDLTPGRPREPPLTAERRPPERKPQAEPAATKLGHGWTPDDFEDDDCDDDDGSDGSDGSDADGDDFEVSALTARRAGAALSADAPSHSHFSSGKPLSPILELDADDPAATVPTAAGAFEVTRDPDGRDLADPRARRDDGGGASPEPALPPAPPAPPSRLAASPGRRVSVPPPRSLSGLREGAAAPSWPAPGEGGVAGEGSVAGGAAPRGEQEGQEEEEALTRMSEVLPRGRVRPVQGDALTRWSEVLLSPLRCEADACVTAVAAFSPDGHHGGQPPTGGPAGEWTIVELESHH